MSQDPGTLSPGPWNKGRYATGNERHHYNTL